MFDQSWETGRILGEAETVIQALWRQSDSHGEVDTAIQSWEGEGSHTVMERRRQTYSHGEVERVIQS